MLWQLKKQKKKIILQTRELPRGILKVMILNPQMEKPLREPKVPVAVPVKVKGDHYRLIKKRLSGIFWEPFFNPYFHHH